MRQDKLDALFQQQLAQVLRLVEIKTLENYVRLLTDINHGVRCIHEISNKQREN